MFYELQQKVMGKWLHEGYFRTYTKLQQAFIHRDGLFRSVNCEFKD